MDRRREMARRLKLVLLVVVVTAALVGVSEGDGFSEGDSSVVGEETQAEGGARSWFWDAVNAVSALAVIVIGVATLYVMFEQKKMAGRQAAWEREFGERELRQEKELREREERLALWDRRYRVVEGVTGVILEALEREEVSQGLKMKMVLEGVGKEDLFEKGKGREEVGELSGMLELLGRNLEELKGDLSQENKKTLSAAVSAILVDAGGAIGRLMDACWKGKR